MKVKDNMIPLSGRISLRMLNSRGVCVYRYDSPNTITYLAPIVLLDLLTGGWSGTTGGAYRDYVAGAAALSTHPAAPVRGFAAPVDAVQGYRENRIAYIGVGSSNTVPTRADSSVEWPHVTPNYTEINDIHYTNNGEVQFTALFDVDQANVPEGGNQNPITEVGLFTRGYDVEVATADQAGQIPPAGSPGAGSRLFARQIHAPVTKSSDFQLEYTWTILFS